MNGEFARLVTPEELPDLEFMHARFSGQTFVPHSHSYLSVTIILEGHWLSRHSGEPYTARSGQIGIVNCDEIHDGLSLDPAGTTYLKLAVGQEILQEVGSLLGSSDRWVPIFTEPVIDDRELAGWMLEKFRGLEADPGRSLRAGEALDLVASVIRRHASGWRGHPRELPDHQAVRHSLEFLQLRSAAEVRPADLAEVSGLSRYHFIRVFREATGLTPHAYLTQLRLEQAQRLLMAGTSIRETAASCGFVDQSHFTNRFKQLHGFTPGEYLRARIG